MKIESSKWYRMRNGDPAWIAGRGTSAYEVPWVGMINAGYHGWYYNGSYTKDSKHPYDLISLWGKTKQVKLPEKITEVWATNSLPDNKLAFKLINQLINYCEFLDKRISDLEAGISPSKSPLIADVGNITTTTNFKIFGQPQQNNKD